MKRILIVNADDCNLTPGVTQAIVRCHDQGIVSSTTWLANFPVRDRELKLVRSRKKLGVGLHLNVTLGRPVTSASKVKSLVGGDGKLKKRNFRMARLPKKSELKLEYENQMANFRKLFGRNPTHLDTHHQLHDHPFFFRVVSSVARRYQLPIRRSCLMLTTGQGKLPRTTDFLFGSSDPSGHWKKGSLESLLRNLPEGVSEIACHPGRHDKTLEAISSFTRGREVEFGLFRAAFLRKLLKEHEVLLSHYGLCYTKTKLGED